MNWADATAYLSDLFLEAESRLPNKDVVLGVIFTLISFLIGWIASLRGSRRRVKARIIDELIQSQVELRKWAYPAIWKQYDTRDEKMLDPFVARLQYLYNSAHETHGLPRADLDRIEMYVMRVKEFITKWSETQIRRDGYHYAYNQSYKMMKLAVQHLGLREYRRLSGLAAPVDDLLDRLAVDPPPQTLSLFPALVPAE